MKKSRMRLLSLLLCAAMLIGMLPPVRVSAEENVAEPVVQAASEVSQEAAEPAEAAPTEVPATEPAPTEAEVTEPASTEAEATEPAPTEAEVTEPAPTEAEATEPVPTEAAPTEPAPAEAAVPAVASLEEPAEEIEEKNYTLRLVTAGGVPAVASAESPTEEEVYAAMMALQTTYYEGMSWTNENQTYTWGILLHDPRYEFKDGTIGPADVELTGAGCVAFAMRVSDAAFGDLPARAIYADQLTYDDIRVGDILRINGDTHTVIVLETLEDKLVIAEGNISINGGGGQVHWGRELTKTEVMENLDFLYTRYPEEADVETDSGTNSGTQTETSQLPIPTSLSWNWPKVSFTMQDTTNVSSYEIQWYFAETADGTPGLLTSLMCSANEVTAMGISESLLSQNGAGYYFFRIRALGSNAAGEWSQMSPAYAYGMETSEEFTQADLVAMINDAKVEGATTVTDVTLNQSLTLTDSLTLDLTGINLKVSGATLTIPAGKTLTITHDGTSNMWSYLTLMNCGILNVDGSLVLANEKTSLAVDDGAIANVTGSLSGIGNISVGSQGGQKNIHGYVGSLHVREGATLTANGPVRVYPVQNDTDPLRGGYLELSGTMNLVGNDDLYASLDIGGTMVADATAVLKISKGWGTVMSTGTLTVAEGTDLTGVTETITKEGGATVTGVDPSLLYSCSDAATTEAFLAAIARGLDGCGTVEIRVTGAVTLAQDLTIPAGFLISILNGGSLTVETGYVLTNYGTINVGNYADQMNSDGYAGTLRINGTLDNYWDIYVSIVRDISGGYLEVNGTVNMLDMGDAEEDGYVYVSMIDNFGVVVFNEGAKLTSTMELSRIFVRPGAELTFNGSVDTSGVVPGSIVQYIWDGADVQKVPNKLIAVIANVETADQLKLAQDYYYIGINFTKDLTLTESLAYSPDVIVDMSVNAGATLTVPTGLNITLNGHNLYVDEGAELVLQESTSETGNNGGSLWLNFGSNAYVDGTLTNYGNVHVGYVSNTPAAQDAYIGVLEINGTMKNYGYVNVPDVGDAVNDAGMYAGGRVNIRGTLENNGFVQIDGDMYAEGVLNTQVGMVNINPTGTLSVTENATVTGRIGVYTGAVVSGLAGANINAVMDVNSEAELTAALQKLETEGYAYADINVCKAFTIASDITIPANASLNITEVPLTVAAGKTLTVNGNMAIYDSSVTINGSLINNGHIVLPTNGDGSHGTLSLAAYSGTGELRVYTNAGNWSAYLIVTDSSRWTATPLTESGSGLAYVLMTYEAPAEEVYTQADFEDKWAAFLATSVEGSFRLEKDLTLTKNLELDLTKHQLAFDGATLRINKGVTLTLVSSGESGGLLLNHGSKLEVAGTLDTKVPTWVNNGSSVVIEATGRVVNYGQFHVGNWNEAEGTVANLFVNGAMDNYGYLNINPVGEIVPTQENPNASGYSGGYMEVNGALSVLALKNTTGEGYQYQGYIENFGVMVVNDGASLTVVNDCIALEVEPGGRLTFNGSVDTTGVAKGTIVQYIWNGSKAENVPYDLISVIANVKTEDQLNIDPGYNYIGINFTEDLTLTQSLAFPKEINVDMSVNATVTLTVPAGLNITLNGHNLYVDEEAELVLQESTSETGNNGGSLWLNFGSNAYIDGTLTNYGNVHVGYVSDSEPGENEYVGVLEINGTGKMVNYGYVNVPDLGDAVNDAGMYAGGRINLRGTMENNGFVQIDGDMYTEGTLVNNGGLNINSTGTLSVTDKAVVTVGNEGQIRAYGQDWQNRVTVPDLNDWTVSAPIVDGAATYVLLTYGNPTGPITVAELVAALDAATGEYVLTRNLTIQEGEDVTLDIDNCDFTVSGATITIAPGGTLTINGNLNGDDGGYAINFTDGAKLNVGGKLNVYGEMFFGDGSVIDINGELKNYSQIHIGTNGNAVTLNVNNRLRNYSYLRICSADENNAGGIVNVTVGGKLENGGNFQIDGDAYFLANDENGYGLLASYGEINIGPDGYLEIAADECVSPRTVIRVHEGSTWVDRLVYPAGPDNGPNTNWLINVHRNDAGEVVQWEHKFISGYTQGNFVTEFDDFKKEHPEGGVFHLDVNLVLDKGLTIDLNNPNNPKNPYQIVLHNAVLRINPGVNVEILGPQNSGGLTLEEYSRLEVQGNLTTYVNTWVNTGSEAYIDGYVQNYANFHVGNWGSQSEGYCGELYVNGTLDNYGYLNVHPVGEIKPTQEDPNASGYSGGYMEVSGNLNVQFVVYNEGTENETGYQGFAELNGDIRLKRGASLSAHRDSVGINVNAPATLTAEEGVTYNCSLRVSSEADVTGVPAENMVINYEFNVTTLEQLKAAVSDYTSNTSNSKEGNINILGNITITEDLEIPDGLKLDMHPGEEGIAPSLTVAKTAELTVYGELHMQTKAQLTIEGTLNHYGYIYMNSDSLFTVNGVVNNYGEIYIGGWLDEAEKFSVMTINGTVNNLGTSQDVGIIGIVKHINDTENNFRSGGTLNLNGTLNVNGKDDGSAWSVVEVSGTLNISDNAQLNLSGAIGVPACGTINVSENFNFDGVTTGFSVTEGAKVANIPADKIYFIRTANTDEQFQQILSEGKGNYKSVEIVVRCLATISGDVTIPRDVYLILESGGYLTVAETATLRIDEQLGVYNGQVLIKGNLINNGHISLDTRDQEFAMKLAEGYTYNGAGSMHIHNLDWANLFVVPDADNWNGVTVDNNGGKFIDMYCVAPYTQAQLEADLANAKANGINEVNVNRPLTLEKDLVIDLPATGNDGSRLYFRTSTLTIPEDVTVTVKNGNLVLASGATMVQNGKMVIEKEAGFWIDDGSTATVNGEVVNYGYYHVGNSGILNCGDEEKSAGILNFNGTMTTYGYVNVQGYDDTIDEWGNRIYFGGRMEVGKNASIQVTHGENNQGFVELNGIVNIASGASISASEECIGININPGATVTAAADVNYQEGFKFRTSGFAAVEGIPAEHLYLYYDYDVTTEEELRNAVVDYKGRTADEGNINIHGDITLTQDLVIPEGLNLNLDTWKEQPNSSLTIPSGKTLTVNSNVNLNSESRIYVSGKLINNGEIYIGGWLNEAGRTSIMIVNDNGVVDNYGTIGIVEEINDTKTGHRSGGQLYVFGTLNNVDPVADDGETGLTYISGTMLVYEGATLTGYISAEATGTLSVEDGVTYTGMTTQIQGATVEGIPASQINMLLMPTTEAELIAAVAEINEKGYKEAKVIIRNDPNKTEPVSITLNQNLTIPGNTSLIMASDTASLIVNTDVTLTVNLEMAIYGNVTIHGSLVNNCTDWRIQVVDGGTLTFEEGSTYTGTGPLWVWKGENRTSWQEGLIIQNGTVWSGTWNEGGYWVMARSEGPIQLAAPTDLMYATAGTSLQASAKLPEDANLGGYEFRFYLAPTTTAEKTLIHTDPSNVLTDNHTVYSNISSLFEKNGDGYYTFQVRALAKDTTVSSDSPWSAMSTPHYYSAQIEENKAEVAATTNTVVTIVENQGATYDSAEKQAEAIQKQVDNTALANTMESDSAVVEAVQKLEEALVAERVVDKGLTEVAPVQVTENAPEEIDITGASITGAELVFNENNDDGEANVSLVIAEPKSTFVVTEYGSNENAVAFSMTLKNADDVKTEGSCAVQIELPVPAKIDPEKMMILHVDTSGNVETIIPTIVTKTEAGVTTYYAQFTLTHFSDFVMLEKVVQSITGTIQSFLTGTASVLLKDSKGYPVETAEITIGTDGQMIIDNVASGTYSLVVSQAKHAKEEYTITVVDETVIQNIVLYLFGDINSDGKANKLDSGTFNRYMAGWSDYTEDMINKSAADLNEDGKVNKLDTGILNRHMANWTDYLELPYKSK